jgi:hypothetical protein
MQLNMLVLPLLIESTNFNPEIPTTNLIPRNESLKSKSISPGKDVEHIELQKRKEKEWWTGRTIGPGFRDPNMRIALVSICAYPPDSRKLMC